MSGTRPITNGELYIPLLFLAIGIVVFIYQVFRYKSYQRGGIFLISLFILGMFLSRVSYFATAASHDGASQKDVPHGQGQPIQISNLGPSSELPLQMPASDISLLETRLAEDLEKRGGERPSVTVHIGKASGKSVLIENVKFSDGIVTRYEGVSGGSLITLTCDYSTSYSAVEVKKACKGEVRKLFGEIDGEV